jgi:hypothetical protein
VHGPHQDRAGRTEQVSTLTPRPASGPRERGFSIPPPAAFVLSLNLSRRHLNELFVQVGQVAVLVSRWMRQPALLALTRQPEKVWPVKP